MKNLFVLLLSICSFSGCSDNAIRVDGVIVGENYDGKTMYLFYPNALSEFKSFEQLSETLIHDGKFSFEINIDESVESEIPAVGYLTMSDINFQSEERSSDETPIATFILEKGQTFITLADNSVALSGTKRNEDFNALHVAIKDLVDFAGLVEKYDSINGLPLDDEGRDGRAQFQLYNGKLNECTYAFVKDNMQNHVGEYLFLRSYTDNLFTPFQLKDLLSVSSSEFNSKEDIQWLNQILEQIGEGNIDMSGLLDKQSSSEE